MTYPRNFHKGLGRARSHSNRPDKLRQGLALASETEVELNVSTGRLQIVSRSRSRPWSSCRSADSADPSLGLVLYMYILKLQNGMDYSNSHRSLLACDATTSVVIDGVSMLSSLYDLSLPSFLQSRYIPEYCTTIIAVLWCNRFYSLIIRSTGKQAV